MDLQRLLMQNQLHEFEAITFGGALALREKPNLVPKPMAWLDSYEFKKHSTSHARNSPARASGRILYVKN